MINHAARANRITVISFSQTALREVRALDQRIPVGVSLRSPNPWVWRAVEELGASLVVPHYSLVGMLARQAAERRVPLAVWTVNRPALLRRMLHHPAVGVVITDVPDIAAHLRNPDKARSIDPAA